MLVQIQRKKCILKHFISGTLLKFKSTSLIISYNLGPMLPSDPCMLILPPKKSMGIHVEMVLPLQSQCTSSRQGSYLQTCL